MPMPGPGGNQKQYRPLQLDTLSTHQQEYDDWGEKDFISSIKHVYSELEQNKPILHKIQAIFAFLHQPYMLKEQVESLENTTILQHPAGTAFFYI